MVLRARLFLLFSICDRAVRQGCMKSVLIHKKCAVCTARILSLCHAGKELVMQFLRGARLFDWYVNLEIGFCENSDFKGTRKRLLQTK